MCNQLFLLQCSIWTTIATTIISSLIYSPTVAIYWYLTENDTDHLPLTGCLFLLNLAWVVLMTWTILKPKRYLYKICFFISLVPFCLSIYRLISYVYYGQSGYEEFFQGWNDTVMSNVTTVLVLLNILWRAIPLVSFCLLWRNTPADDPFRYDKAVLI